MSHRLLWGPSSGALMRVQRPAPAHCLFVHRRKQGRTSKGAWAPALRAQPWSRWAGGPCMAATGCSRGVSWALHPSSYTSR